MDWSSVGVLLVFLTTLRRERLPICEANSSSFWESVDLEGLGLVMRDLERERAPARLSEPSSDSWECDLPV